MKHSCLPLKDRNIANTALNTNQFYAWAQHLWSIGSKGYLLLSRDTSLQKTPFCWSLEKQKVSKPFLTKVTQKSLLYLARLQKFWSVRLFKIQWILHIIIRFHYCGYLFEVCKLDKFNGGLSILHIYRFGQSTFSVGGWQTNHGL